MTLREGYETVMHTIYEGGVPRRFSFDFHYFLDDNDFHTFNGHIEYRGYRRVRRILDLLDTHLQPIIEEKAREQVAYRLYEILKG